MNFKYVWKVLSPEHITDGKVHVKICLQVKAWVTQARTTIDLFRLSVIEQSNYVLKQVVIALATTR